MTKKAFDCVEQQHRGGAEIARRTAGMTVEEKVAYWHERAEELRKRQAAIRKQRQRTA